jgi:hypothetical protein
VLSGPLREQVRNGSATPQWLARLYCSHHEFTKP